MADQRNGGIAWCEESWNPIRGCSRISPGCGDSNGGGCYAERQAIRQSGPGQAYEGLVRSTSHGPRWTGAVRLVEDHLFDPIRWTRPRRIFVNSMSDLFHEKLDFYTIDQIVAVMLCAPQHTYQVLTKRADRMRLYLSDLSLLDRLRAPSLYAHELMSKHSPTLLAWRWPAPNIWWGVSVEDQKASDTRLRDLVKTPAVVRWVSFEPLIGPVDASLHLDREILEGQPQSPKISWAVIGGESGPGARPCATEWIEWLVEQCKHAGVAPFVKQLGSYVVSEGRTAPAALMGHPEKAFKATDRAPNGEYWAWRAGLKHSKGGDPEEWPEELRVREYPVVGVD